MPVARGPARGSTQSSDIWRTLEQSELATALSAKALGVGLGVEPGVYAVHHISSLMAVHRLRRWQIQLGASDARTPWAIRHTPVVHGWIIAQLAAIGRRWSAAEPPSDDVALSDDATLTSRLAELLRLSVQRSCVLHGSAERIDPIGCPLVGHALAATAVLEADIAGSRPLALTRVTRLAKVVLAVELTMAARLIAVRRVALPSALHRVIQRIERSLHDIEQHALHPG
jgi:hypothetical protein